MYTEKNNTFTVSVNSEKVALFVWLDAHSIPGHFSENGFLLYQMSKSVKFYPDNQNVTKEELESVLTVTHLTDEKYFT